MLERTLLLLRQTFAHDLASCPTARQRARTRFRKEERGQLSAYSENAPDYRLQVVGGAEIGATWKKTSQADRPYLSVILDDLSLPTAIYARLLEGEDGEHSLIWSRTKSE